MHRLIESPTTEKKVVNENTDTLIIDHPDPKEAIAHFILSYRRQRRQYPTFMHAQASQ